MSNKSSLIYGHVGFCGDTATDKKPPDSNVEELKKDALKTQIGGDHYKDMAIQPIEFILANDLPFCEGNIVKYICRYKAKGGSQDLKKVIHYAELLLEHIDGNY
jgi:hypothetical protein